MAVIHESDTVQDSSLTWSFTDGITLTRRFIVNELTGNRSAIVYNAVRADGIPKPGDKHPDIIGSYVDTVTGNALGGTTCEVLVSYKPFISEEEDVFKTKRISATVQSVETNKYYLRGVLQEKPMTVQYKWKVGNMPGTEQLDIQVGTVKKEQPSIVTSIERTEDQDPWRTILKYQGKVNSAFYSGGAKRTWLLSGIETETKDGLIWQVNYQFQYNPQTWQATPVYVDPRTNIPPSDVGGKDQAAAIGDYTIYEEIDFRRLGLGG